MEEPKRIGFEIIDNFHYTLEYLESDGRYLIRKCILKSVGPAPLDAIIDEFESDSVQEALMYFHQKIKK